MSPDTRRRLQQAFKNHKPSSVRAKLADDEFRDLAPGKSRSLWLPILEALDTLPWVSVELLDVKGRQMGAPISNDGAATELETISGSSVSTRTAEVAQLLALTQRGTDSNLRWFTDSLKPTLDAQTRVANMAMEQAEHYRDLADKADRRAERAERERDALIARVGDLVDAKETKDEAGWAKTVGEIVQAAPSLMQLGRMGLFLLKGGKVTTAAASASTASSSAASTAKPAGAK